MVHVSLRHRGLVNRHFVPEYLLMSEEAKILLAFYGTVIVIMVCAALIAIFGPR